MNDIPLPLLYWVMSWFTPSGLLTLAVGYIGVKIAFRVAGVLAARLFHLGVRVADDFAQRVSQVIVSKIEETITRIEKGWSEDPETKKLRRDWKREFASTISWEEFLRMNEELKKPKQEKSLNDYGKALLLFSLVEPFSRADFDTRYKRVMVGVHPDRGGSDFLASQVNVGRDVIMQARGWR